MGQGGVEPPTSRLSGDELGVGKSDEMPSFPRQLAHSAGVPFPESLILPELTDTVTDTHRADADRLSPKHTSQARQSGNSGQPPTRMIGFPPKTLGSTVMPI